MTTTATLPTDTATEDAKALGSLPEFTIPPGLAEQGFEVLPAHPLWGLGADIRYVYKPLRAWDAAQKMADDVIARTAGHVNLLAHELMLAMRETAAIERQKEESQDDFDMLRGQVWVKLANETWSRFLQACPRFEPYRFAREVIDACQVRRVPADGEDSKPGNDPDRDPGGPIFSVTGGGHVDRYYKGRRHHVLRIGLCAFWGSCGDFFAGA